MNNYLIYAIGLVAQILFSARLIVQWVKSEKAGRTLSPTIFWQLSLIASFLLMAYGILRNDLVIILGQALSYFIYIRNLQYKGAWKLIPYYFKITVIVFPFLAIAWLSTGLVHSWSDILHNDDISMFMLTWGGAGQIIFTFRFVYQWYFSEQKGKSVLPAGFWIISLVGSAVIVVYGIYRQDPIILLGQSFGVFIYIRNLFLIIKNKRNAARNKK